MPYLTKELKTYIAYHENNSPADPGQLNYLVTLTVIKYLRYKGLKYIGVNDVVGALESAKLEFYRRIAAPYEDKKIIENGDVYQTLIDENKLSPEDLTNTKIGE